MRVVYFGSPEFAVPTLETLAADPAFEVALVVTQAAKGLSPVERAAEALKLPVYKPATLRDAASRQPLLAVDADLFVVAAFGLIFRQHTLEIPRLGCVNVHPSLLPRYRGAIPIVAAIAQGDSETGVSLTVMDAGIDTGAIISMEQATIDDEDTAESLGKRLAGIGAALTVRDIPRWVGGDLIDRPQADIGASLTRSLLKADGWIDWTRPAVDIDRHVRAMWPWPRAWTTVDDTTLQVHRIQVVSDEPAELAPGTIIPARQRLLVATGQGALEVLTVEPAGRRAMPANAYLNGRREPLVSLGGIGAPPPRPPLVVPVPPHAREEEATSSHCG